MSTEAPAEDKTKTKDQVAALLKEGKSAKEIADALGKTPATVYVHIRNITGKKGTGKRGRPPKVQTENGEQATASPRPRPGASAAAKPAASSNGASHADRFPRVKEAIEAELQDARSQVTLLERMLAQFS